MTLNLLKDQDTHNKLRGLLNEKLEEYINMYKEALPDYILQVIEQENKSRRQTREAFNITAKEVKYIGIIDC